MFPKTKWDFRNIQDYLDLCKYAACYISGRCRLCYGVTIPELDFEEEHLLYFPYCPCDAAAFPPIILP